MKDDLVIVGDFEWSKTKETLNIQTHGIEFQRAILAFGDSNRIYAIDEKHSNTEERLFCIGQIGRKIVTVRFTYRSKRIRIIGAGYWRKGAKLYEKKKSEKKL